jgi:hypothetical protein
MSLRLKEKVLGNCFPRRREGAKKGVCKMGEIGSRKDTKAQRKISHRGKEFSGGFFIRLTFILNRSLRW